MKQKQIQITENNKATYHCKEDGIDKAFTMLAEDYRDFGDLKRRAEPFKSVKFYN